MTLPCDDLEIWIERLRDGDLAGQALRDARRHIDLCESCRGRFEELDQIAKVLVAALGDVAPPVAGDELTRRIMARIPLEPPAAASPAASLTRGGLSVRVSGLRSWQYAVAAGIAGFLLVLSFLWLERRPAPTEVAEEESQGESVHVDLAAATSETRPGAPAVRLVSSPNPDVAIVWIGSDAPQP